jgi:hypothetical protein
MSSHRLAGYSRKDSRVGAICRSRHMLAFSGPLRDFATSFLLRRLYLDQINASGYPLNSFFPRSSFLNDLNWKICWLHYGSLSHESYQRIRPYGASRLPSDAKITRGRGNSGVPVVSLTHHGSPVTLLHLNMSWSLMLWTWTSISYTD